MKDSEASEQIQCIRRRWKKNVLREIYLYEDLVIKRFVRAALFPDMRRPWVNEDRSLRRLSDLKVPATYGFLSKKIKGAREIIFVRDYMAGDIVVQFQNDDILPLARLLALVHERGVVTCDPEVDNFIRLPDGGLSYIDFGRAKVFPVPTPLYYHYVGKELARMRHITFRFDDALHGRFLQNYWKLQDFSKIGRNIVESGYGFWDRHWSRRQKHRDRRGNRL